MKILATIDRKTIDILESVASSAENAVRRELYKVLWDIPDIESEILPNMSIRITFELRSSEIVYFNTDTLERVLSRYGKVRGKRFSYPEFTPSYTQFTYDIKCDFEGGGW